MHVCPEDAADIPDIDEARLVILHPKLTHKRGVSDSDAIAFAKAATEHRGAANRTYRNMLVYLAGDRDRIEELERSVREYLGWSEILAKEDDLNLTTSQRNQATERQTKASETTDARLLGAYQWALVPTGQPIEIQPTKVEGQATSLAERVSRRLGNDGALTVQHAYMPRLRDGAVLDAGLTGSGRRTTLHWPFSVGASGDESQSLLGMSRAPTMPVRTARSTSTKRFCWTPPSLRPKASNNTLRCVLIESTRRRLVASSRFVGGERLPVVRNGRLRAIRTRRCAGEIETACVGSSDNDVAICVSSGAQNATSVFPTRIRSPSRSR